MGTDDDAGPGHHISIAAANKAPATKGAVALLPEPFKVNAEAVDLAAAAARAALRRTTGVFARFPRPAPTPAPDPFLSAVEPLKLP